MPMPLMMALFLTNFFINVLDYKGLAEIINSEELAQSDETGKIPESVELANKFLAVQTFLSYLMPQNKQVKSIDDFKLKMIK